MTGRKKGIQDSMAFDRNKKKELDYTDAISSCDTLRGFPAITTVRSRCRGVQRESRRALSARMMSWMNILLPHWECAVPLL